MITRAPLQKLSQNIPLNKIQPNFEKDLKENQKLKPMKLPPKLEVFPEKNEIVTFKQPNSKSFEHKKDKIEVFQEKPENKPENKQEIKFDLDLGESTTEERKRLVENVKKNTKEPEAWRSLLSYEFKINSTRDKIMKIFLHATTQLPTQKLRKVASFINIWLHYILFQSEISLEDAKNSIKFLKTNRVGFEDPSFYLVWAQIESKSNQTPKAILILEKGISKNMNGGEILKQSFELLKKNESIQHFKIIPLFKRIEDEEETVTFDNSHNKLKDNDNEPTVKLDHGVILKPIIPQKKERERDDDDQIISLLKRRKMEPQNQVIKKQVDDSPSPQSSEIIYVNNVAYTKISLLGKGGSSKVFKVFNPKKVICALKKVRLKGIAKQTVQGFINEIEMLKQLSGKPNIVQYIDSEVRQQDQILLLVMECGDCDLSALLKSKKLNDNHLRLYWQQMLEAVQTIHNEKIVHSDLKPANFLIVKGSIKLIDFGIANSIQNDTTNIVRENQVGTVNYMSPEAINENPQVSSSNAPKYKLGRSSDIWSLGCILYQMVYGKTPFSHLNMVQAIHAITDVSHEIQFPDIKNPLLLDVLKKTLQRDHTKRPTIPDLLKHPFLLNSNDGSTKIVFESELLKLIHSVTKDEKLIKELLESLEKGIDITNILNKIKN